jgi:hypothetical protein
MIQRGLVHCPEVRTGELIKKELLEQTSLG